MQVDRTATSIKTTPCADALITHGARAYVPTTVSPGSRAGLFMSEPPYVSMVVSYVEFTQEFRYVSLTRV